MIVLNSKGQAEPEYLTVKEIFEIEVIGMNPVNILKNKNSKKGGFCEKHFEQECEKCKKNKK